MGNVDEEDPASIRRFLEAMAPLDAHRLATRASTEAEAEASAPDAPSAPTTPTTPA